MSFIKVILFENSIFANIKKSKKAIVAFCIIVIMICTGLFAPLIANNQPYYIHVYQHSYFPIFSIQNQIVFYDENNHAETIDCRQIDWKHLPFESAIFPPIAYSPNSSDLLNADYKSPYDEQYFKNQNQQIDIAPLKFRHYLGTNKRGEDVCSGLIHGASTSLLVGIISMFIAGFLGILFGLISGYYRNDKWKMKKGTFIFLLVAILLSWFYGVNLRWYDLQDAMLVSAIAFLIEILISLSIISLILFAGYLFSKFLVHKISWFSKPINLPIDLITTKIIEIIASLPVIVLIISIAAITKPSFFNLILIIGLIQWTSIARLIRAEMLKIRDAEFMQAAEIIGLKSSIILMKHALPNVISPAIVSMAFGVAQAILIESSLSFLGIGLPPDLVSWGSLINSGRENFNAWWLVVFPGILIFVTVLSFNILGDALQTATANNKKSQH